MCGGRRFQVLVSAFGVARLSPYEIQTTSHIMHAADTPNTPTTPVELRVVHGRVGAYGHRFKSTYKSEFHDFLIVRSWPDVVLNRDDKLGFGIDTIGLTFHRTHDFTGIRSELEQIITLKREPFPLDGFLILTTDPRFNGADYLFTY